MSHASYTGVLPILALRGLAVFPDQTIHFDVGRQKSIAALEAAMKKNQTLLLIPQKDLLVDDPRLADLYPIGTVARIKQVLKSQGDNLRVLVTGLCRGRITEINQSEPYLEGMVESVSEETAGDELRSKALRREAGTVYTEYLEASEHPAQIIQMRILASDSDGFIADTIAQNSGIDFSGKIQLLTELNPAKRLEMAISCFSMEMAISRRLAGFSSVSSWILPEKSMPEFWAMVSAI